jgi:hypothetical protein
MSIFMAGVKVSILFIISICLSYCLSTQDLVLICFEQVQHNHILYTVDCMPIQLTSTSGAPLPIHSLFPSEVGLPCRVVH